jgi:hypothetical protein
MTTNPFKKLRPYARHKDGCAAGYTDMCVCKHRLNNNFRFSRDYSQSPCAHCKCAQFIVGECSCGLTKLLKSLRGKA